MPSAPLNGIDVVFDDSGGDGEPVVLVNGTGATRTAWRAHQTPALVAAGYRVIAPDNRGIPPNALPPGGITLEAMAADLAALIEHLALRPAASSASRSARRSSANSASPGPNSSPGPY
ncbi:hypothetical protein GA0115253_104525 [Streptomyces sp. Termitarium-T10T-6]|nr:hypothetical protein GA0115253_104525 [Streptomyces sp. Termitarium-T10T-6]